MADTTKSLVQLQTLFADNTNGAISPQDLRDFLVTMKLPCGSVYMTTPAATVISTPNTYVKAAGTTSPADGTSAYLFNLTTSNRLTYTGTIPMHFHVVASVSMSLNVANHNVGLKIAKNGTVLDHSEVVRKISTGGDVGSTAVHADCMLSENDYVELWVADKTSSSEMTINNLYLFAMGMFR